MASESWLRASKGLVSGHFYTETHASRQRGKRRRFGLRDGRSGVRQRIALTTNAARHQRGDGEAERDGADFQRPIAARRAMAVKPAPDVGVLERPTDELCQGQAREQRGGLGVHFHLFGGSHGSVGLQAAQGAASPGSGELRSASPTAGAGRSEARPAPARKPRSRRVRGSSARRCRRARGSKKAAAPGGSAPARRSCAHTARSRTPCHAVREDLEATDEVVERIRHGRDLSAPPESERCAAESP